MAGLNELISEVHDAGAMLVVEKGRLGIRGEVPEDLKNRIIEHREELAKYLSWDSQEAHDLMRRAWAYVAKHYERGAWGLVDRDDTDYPINLAYAKRDMWAYRTAVRSWVEAWLEAISKAKGEGEAA